jgi:two-component system sensor histidine kinase/response regulator
LSKGQILIVEDEGITALHIRNTLEGLGYDVVGISSYGEDAINKAAEVRPDLVLMDIILKGIVDGIDAAEKIRAILNIPVIYLTAHADDGTLQRAMLTEPFGYIVKPFSERDLSIAIEFALYRSRMEADRQRLISQLRENLSEREAAEERIGALNEQLKRHIDELAAANGELEAFNYSVSHDLRVPLRLIKSYSEMLVEEHAAGLDEEAGRLLASIRSHALKMDGLINALITLSQVGRQELHISLLDMEQLARAAFEELAATLQDREVRFTVHPLPQAGGDLPLIRQVLSNLLRNALKFTRNRKIAEIEMGGRAEDFEIVYFVKDNGAGFDTQFSDRLFRAFQRLHSQKEFEGTGIGLSIVQRIIARHGGRVWAEGRPDEEATFYFSLPCSAVPPAQPG